MIVRKSTIDSYVKLLNSFVSDENLSVKDRAYKYKVNYSVFKIATELGLLKRVSNGKYLATKGKYEPIDARKVAMGINTYINGIKKSKEKPNALTIKTNNVNKNTKTIIKMKTRQATIKRYLGFLNSFVEEKNLPVNKRTRPSAKCKYFGIGAGATVSATELGLLKRIGYSNYEPIKEQYDVADAKKLSAYLSAKVRESFIKHETISDKTKSFGLPMVDEPKKVQEANEPPVIVAKPKVTVTHVKQKKPVRVFSLFWGLIKFNY